MREDLWRPAWQVVCSHSAVCLLVVITLLKGVLWSATIPFGQAPDEPTHLGAIQFLGEFGRLPRAKEVYMSDEVPLTWRLTEGIHIYFHPDVQQTFSETQEGPNEQEILTLDQSKRHSFEWQQISRAMFVPPLYHGLASIAYRLVYGRDILTRAYTVRTVSVVLAGLLVWVAYRFAREAFPLAPEMWHTIPIVISFHPMVTYMGAVANSDILSFVLLSIITLLLVRILRRGLQWRRAAALGVTIGLGLLTKPMILASGAGVALVLLVELARHPSKWRQWLLMSILILVLALSISGWQIVRSYRIQGSPLYNNPYPRFEGWTHLEPSPDLTFAQWWQKSGREGLKNATFRTYWGLFGWVDTPMPWDVYLTLRHISNLSLLGLAVYVIIMLKRGTIQNDRLLLLLLLLMLSLSMLPPVLARSYLIAKNAGKWGSSLQGRYHLGACVAQMTLLVLGLTAIVSEEAKPLAHLAVRFGVIALNVIALVEAVIPRYYL